MSLSSSETSAPTAALLREAFKILARELPAGYAAVCAQLHDERVRLKIDDEAEFTVDFDQSTARVSTIASSDGHTADADEHTAVITASKRAILDILDARTSLARAVLDGRVGALASLARLDRLRAGLVICTHAAVRCDSMPRVLTRFRELAREGSPAVRRRS